MAKALDSKPARTDFTDRECAKLLGGLIGALCQITTPETVRAAVKHWAQTDASWEAIKHFNARMGVNPAGPKKN